ncbi:hypothetical protein M5689_024985 [Euphorbia peplus]|nr:hypothetical protein M5689_024985 [Euphorbia peplus]
MTAQGDANGEISARVENISDQGDANGEKSSRVENMTGQGDAGGKISGEHDLPHKCHWHEKVLKWRTR